MKKKYDIKTTDVETLKKWYHLMTLGRALDEKAPSYLLQSLGWSYHAPYAGHDGIQLAVGQVFTLGEDFLFPYYRDMLTVLSAGMTAEEVILNGISKATDPGSGGRHMSNHFCLLRIRFPATCRTRLNCSSFPARRLDASSGRLAASPRIRSLKPSAISTIRRRAISSFRTP